VSAPLTHRAGRAAHGVVPRRDGDEAEAGRGAAGRGRAAHVPRAVHDVPRGTEPARGPLHVRALVPRRPLPAGARRGRVSELRARARRRARAAREQRAPRGPARTLPRGRARGRVRGRRERVWARGAERAGARSGRVDVDEEDG
jgi:hypothetical protein